MELPLWPSWLRTRHCLCEDVGSIPHLAQWAKDPVLPEAGRQGLHLVLQYL